MQFKLAASAALAVLFSATTAFAQDTLQVVSGPTGQRAVTVPTFGPLGQSFTAIDEHLTSFGFQFELFNPGHANSPFTFQLLAGEGLGGSVVTTKTFTLPTSINDRTATWFDFDLTGTDVTVGSKYTAVLSTSSLRYGVVLGPEINIFTGQILGGDAYAGGTALFTNVPYSNCGPTGGCDLNFRVTGYNDVAAVPEPAAWGMMIGGFGLAGGALRRRKAVRTTVRFA
jgi:hypothetical protein